MIRQIKSLSRETDDGVPKWRVTISSKLKGSSPLVLAVTADNPKAAKRSIHAFFASATVSVDVDAIGSESGS